MSLEGWQFAGIKFDLTLTFTERILICIDKNMHPRVPRNVSSPIAP